jgi:hypothetical protein
LLFNNLDSCRYIHCALGQFKKGGIEGVLLTIVRQKLILQV